jgi:class 3 adenylate cyclase
VGTLPPIRFVTTADGVRIAYCCHGEGAPLVFVRGWASHLGLMWEEDAYRAYFEKLARHLQVVRFDARANGLSDRDVERLDLDGLTDDVEAVMDGLGLNEVAMWGSGFGAPIAITYVTRHPERVSRLILDGAYATMKDQGTPEARESYRAMLAALPAQPDAINAALAYMQDPESEVVGKRVEFVRRSINPKANVQLSTLAVQYDVSHLLPTLDLPTLVLHRRRERLFPLVLGRTMASLIPAAQFVAIEGTASHLWRERPGDSLAAIADFLGLDMDITADNDDAQATADESTPVETDRVIKTVLFTDFVGSTEQVAALGDRRWRERLAAHDEMADREVRRFRGRKIKSTGDGILAIFDGPARAIQCASAIRDGAQELDIVLRAGLHTGEVELVGDDVAGIAVHIAARIVRQAAAGQVVVSGTVKELATGSGLAFTEAGSHEFRGVSGRWQLFAVEEHAPAAAPRSAAAHVFHREGEYWTIADEGATFRLRDTRGLHFIARLLAVPGRELHVRDLESGGEVAVERIATGPAAEAGLVGGGDVAIPGLDAAAKAAYKHRLDELAEELEEAQQFHDPERAARAQAEIDAVVQELSGAVGLGGRDRPAGSATERARVNVTRSIKTAMRRIEEHSPSLGNHLATTIRTGTYCSYNPDPRLPITWDL